jgi:hypothetical protein
VAEQDWDERNKRSPGPEPERLKINSPSWEDAVEQMLRTPRPPAGWPEDVKKPPKKKRGPK